MSTTLELLTRADLLQFKKDLIEELSKLFSEKPKTDETEFLKSKQVKGILKCSDSTLQHYRDSGRLPFYKIDSTYYYTWDGITKFINSSSPD